MATSSSNSTAAGTRWRWRTLGPWLLPAGLSVWYALYLRAGELWDSPYFGAQVYDAEQYYLRTRLFYDAAGRFSLLHYSDSLRGYLWPLILLATHPQTGGVPATDLPGHALIAAFRPLGVGLAAALFGVAGPLLWTRLRGQAPPMGRQVLFAVLGFVFWRDYFHFALTDMPGLLALVLGLSLVLTRRPAALAMAAAGLLLGTALLLRPVFLVATTAAVTGAGGLLWRNRALSGARRLALLGMLLVGVGLPLAPQWLINQRHFQQNYPLVLGWLDPAHPHSLYVEQLTWGLRMQKYESSLAPDRSAQMIYADSAGAFIATDAGLAPNASFATASDYARAVWRHWPDALLVYGRHLFNALDIRQPTPYLRAFSGWSVGLAVLNFSVLFGALLVLLFRRPALDRGRTAVVLVALLLPCAAVLPTAIEVRFLLPLHLLIYGVVSFGWPANWTPSFAWRLPQRGALAVAYGIFVGGCLLLSAGTHTQLAGWTPLLAP